MNWLLYLKKGSSNWVNTIMCPVQSFLLIFFFCFFLPFLIKDVFLRMWISKHVHMVNELCLFVYSYVICRCNVQLFSYDDVHWSLSIFKRRAERYTITNFTTINHYAQQKQTNHRGKLKWISNHIIVIAITSIKAECCYRH